MRIKPKIAYCSIQLVSFMALVLLGVNLVSCATTTGEHVVRSSVLANFNPAPKSMSPPDVVSEDPVLDPTHVGSQADYHFALGEALSLDGDSEKAIEEFKLASVYDATSAAIPLRIGNEYLKQGLLTEALEQAELAEKLEPENFDVHVFMGGLYAALKMYKQAFEKYKLAADKDPKNQEVPLYIGALYAEQEQYDLAEKYFRQAIRKPGGEKNHLAYYYIGKMRLSQLEKNNEKNSVLAEKAFINALTEKPDFDDGALALADLYFAQGKKDKGIKLLESFQEQFGPKKSIAFQLSQLYLDAENYSKAYTHLKTLESFEPQNLNVKVKIALILIEQKKYDVAIEKLEQIVAMAPSSDKIRFYLAAVYEEVGRAKLAIQNYVKIESSSTYYGDAVVHAAYLYRKNDNVKDAKEILQKAVMARDDLPQVYAFYASLLDEQHDYNKGIALLESAVKKFPENTQLHFYLGSMYDRVGRSEDTISEMRKVLAKDENHVQALNYLAYTFAERDKDLDEAESLARRAMKLQPNDGFIVDTLGWVLFKQGRVEDAIQYLEAAFRLKPQESVIAEHLGDAYYVFELADKAKQMYIKAATFETNKNKISKIKAKIFAVENNSKSKRSPASSSESR